ncbi:MAG: lysophospholipid acyltransferase family protein [Candidatus Omnitrophica bacterium]|nr:lysophospholipid acyltransferase family protein [Candidatus Omnitrophota bacterium]
MRHSLKEYPAYISVRLLMAVFSILPISAVLFIGKLVGTLQFYLDKKHRDIAYKNLRIALAREKSPQVLRAILKKNFQGFAQNFAELLCLGRINKAYVEKYLVIEGRQHIEAAFKRGKGVIFSGVHEGNWELSNASISLLGYPFSIIAETQRNKLLNALLDKYRRAKGYGVIPANSRLRSIIHCLKFNQGVGVVMDHGALQEGVLVEFFNRLAYTPTGALRLAIKYDAALLLGYVYRLNGPYHKLVIMPPFTLSRSPDLEKDLYLNLRKINSQIEDFIKAHPEEYLWSYKRWKNSPQRNVVIINDGNIRNLDSCRAKLAEIKSRCKGLRFEVSERSLNSDLMRIYADIVIAPRCLKKMAEKLARQNQAEVYYV